ncbi:patatin-like protein [Rhizobiales bacterium]|uniref:patatin-like protein n=1 Tax=Hongsoonwoonella zoysiae TaxID=2821844 RepID=UPI0015612391|nr:patatin-like protein [Hongsoonwoonella zoysiae]NRG19238.1 patatin-like protein [Hongsoonwoonella zoysiae]
MKQIELRLALVLYGGVSLAVYMHGVTREFLNIVRASKRHEEGLYATEAETESGADERPTSTDIYRRLLKELAPEINIRVVVDVIAGASAGGINGVMLARAISHDLDLGTHRDLWLANADVTRLANEPVGLTRYLKGSIAPVIDRLLSMGLNSETSDPETREKLRQFIQARWFTPPFSGERFVEWMLDAAEEMGRAKATADDPSAPARTLIPQGQRLDLFVTLTDFYGRLTRFEIDNAGMIEEMEHRRVLRFKARHRSAGDVTSEFSDRYIPTLVFAARATAAFPGAFPPMTVGEMDRVIEARGEPWAGGNDPRGRRQLLLEKIGGERDDNPESRIFVDGSVVMNKPLQPVIDAIANRPASREVVRRLVYVDPLPMEIGDGGNNGEDQELPSFFHVIFASMAHIPRNEPIGDALQQVADLNHEARLISDVIAASEPVIEREVSRIIKLKASRPPTMKELTAGRIRANEAAHKGAGYTYFGYQRLKLRVVSEKLGMLIARLAQLGGADPREADITESIIARLDEFFGENPDAGATPEPVIEFLRGLDVDYRIRRLRFVIRRLNALYHASPPGGARSSEQMDELKTTLYEHIDHLTRRWSRDFYGEETISLAADFAMAGRGNEHAMTRLLDILKERMGLADLDHLTDDVFSVMAYNYLDPELRMDLTSAYVGFAFYDLVTLPVMKRPDTAELNEIRIDRISPSDPHTLHPEGITLKGTSLNAFGAFFNRRWREHDYLWGRLSAADRLITLLLSAAEATKKLDTGTIGNLRRDAFLTILREEAPHLVADPDLVPGLLAQVEQHFQALRDVAEPA